jgi:hypothetical protein
MNSGIIINLGLNKLNIMQGNWMTRETENISKTLIYQWFKEKYKLKESFQIWSSVKVPFLFNKKVAIVFYIERGYLDFKIYDLNTFYHYFSSFSGVNGYEDFDFKTYYQKVNESTIDEIGGLECMQYLTFYIRFIDEYLPDVILKADFSKLNRYMKKMEDRQIEEMIKMLND